MKEATLVEFIIHHLPTRMPKRGGYAYTNDGKLYITQGISVIIENRKWVKRSLRKFKGVPCGSISDLTRKEFNECKKIYREGDLEI